MTFKFDYMNQDYCLNEELMLQLVVIDDDRYSGAYSNASYTAWRGGKPDDIDAGDTTCEEFWKKYRNCLHGRGNTPQEAFRDLLVKVESQGWDFLGPLLVVIAPCRLYGEEQAILKDSDAFKTWLGA